MNSKTKLAYICGGRSFFSANLSRKISEVAETWRRTGHDVMQLCGGDLLGSAKISSNYGSQETFERWYRKMPGTGPLIRSLSEWRDIEHDRLLNNYLETAFRKFRPKVVWERSCRLHCAGLSLARRFGVPYVLEWKDHLVDYRFSLFRSKALEMESQKNREADYLVVESGVLRDTLEREGVKSSKIIVAHNAVQADKFIKDEGKRTQVRKYLGLDGDTVLAGYLGSYAFYHDTARLVLAADIIRKKYADRKIKILMVGAGEEYKDSRKLAQELGLLENVLLMKPGVPKDEVPGILAALDIGILPGSTDIICPIKIQEYMACELPPVAPDYACNREVLRDGESGMFFKPKDEVDLAEKIVALAGNRELRVAMGKRARKEVIRRFSWEATWGAALETVLEQSDSRLIEHTSNHSR